jgi:hypothetical protein
LTRAKSGGRQRGTPNRVTADIRQALRDLADGNAQRVQEWLDRVAQTDPGEAMRLWLALLRFVTPTLQAAAIADLTPSGTPQALFKLSDAELLGAIAAHRTSYLQIQHDNAPSLSPDFQQTAEDSTP